jgi:integrase
MAYQRGSLKQVERKAGLTWILRYRVARSDGKSVEHAANVGLVRDFPKKADALREVDKLGLLVRINDESADTRISFHALAEHYLKSDMGEDAIRPKSATTIPIVEHYVRDYLIPTWGKELADDIAPLALQRWLKSLNTERKLAWTTVSKIRGIMRRVYRVGLIHELVTKNPVEHVETRTKTNYRAIVISPAQTLQILESLSSPLHYALVLTCAATALRASEILSLRWADIAWSEERIRVSKRWAKGEDGETKTEASNGYVPLHPLLADRLRAWQMCSPYPSPHDFVFPSFRKKGKLPLYASSFVADHLRPAAITVGVAIAPGQRFGLHNLRHSLSNWLVNAGKVQPKTVQGLLRHSKIQTTLDLYTQSDNDETRAAQGQFLNAVGLMQRVQ